MEYIVKQTNVPVFEIKTEDKQFQLFTIDTVKDINETDVQIPRSIGIYTLVSLTTEKTRLLERLKELDNQINAINDIINNEK